MSKKLTNEEIIQMRKDYLIPAYMQYYKKPVQIVRGENQYVYDEKGKRYLDGFSAVVTISVGHCHPDVMNEVLEQTKRLQHITTLYLSEPIVDYAKLLADHAPGNLRKSFFTNSGTEANEFAALLCKNKTGKQEFISLRHSFHGRTLQAMTFTGQSIWRHSMPYVFGVSHAPAAYCYRCPYNLTYPNCDLVCAQEVEQIIKYSTSGKIAGFIGEPIQGFGGVIDPPPEYFKLVYDIVRKYGGLCISDEVQTGFGRTGDKFFGIEHWGVTPDIITMAKGQGNGVPLGGVITTDEVAESFRGLTHFSTYGGNPVSMTQGAAVIRAIDKNDFVKRNTKIGNKLKEGLLSLMDKHKIIGDVRGKGLMLGFELVKDRKTKAAFPEAALELMEETKDRGLFIGKGGMAGNCIRIKPPYCITDEDVDFIIKTLDVSLGLVKNTKV